MIHFYASPEQTGRECAPLVLDKTRKRRIDIDFAEDGS
jgi:hypothetical protein